MVKRLSALLLALVFSFTLIAQEGNDSIPAKDSIPEEKEPVPKEMFYGPTIGLGVGMFKFYGDIMDASYGNPFISNIGYDLHVKQQLNPFLTAKFYVLFGTVSANERSAERNLNFRSALRVGGFALIYNFDHILPEKRIISPFVSLGIESVEFHSKTDLYDEFGNEYNYWSDGSIRNLAENDPNASSAIVIQRDYVFETDMRELNEDGFGKYAERTFAIPVGAGATMHMTNNIDFTVGMTYHFTFSDLMDNITDESSGDRIGDQLGNGGNDRFLMSSFSVSYNFLKHKKGQDIETFEEDIDYLAYDTEDEDGDGVIDFIDECPWTPAGVEVDEKGCPLDKDSDFVPNYKDDELETRDGAPVTRTGVEMTDDMIYERYQRYLDSTGMFAETETRIIAAEKRKKKKKYKVQVGEFTGAIDADLVDQFLSIPDVEIKAFGDTLTVIAVGDYDNLPDAVKRKMQLTEQGFDAAIVVEEEKDGTFSSVGDAANNMSVNDNGTSTVPYSKEVVFRVQLGAFSKRLTEKDLHGLKNVMEIKGTDGLYKYLYSQSFKTVEEAAGKKIDLAVDYGVEDAFVVAYKGGKRITLKEAGASTTGSENIPTAPTKNYDKEKIKFKIQIGSYKNQLPTEVLSKFMELEGVEQTSKDGLTRYTAGNFSSYEEAAAYQAKVVEAGIGGAFVIATHDEELIPVEKAKEIKAQ